MTIKMASESTYSQVDWLPTGLPQLDAILGGGIPTKRITEISGKTSVGKTTLALMLIAQAQKEGYTTLWIDQEWSWSGTYEASLGVDLTKLYLVQEKFAEDALDQVDAWATEHKNAFIVLDAVGALHPRAEGEKEMAGRTIGGQAGLVAKFCRKIVPTLAINNIGLIVINHEYIDVMSGRMQTSGGMKLSYHKSLWLSLRKANKKVMKGEDQIGIVVEAEVKKTKLAPTQGQKAELVLLFGQGFNKESNLMDEAIEKGIITKKGQFYYFGEEKYRGANALRDALKDESFAAKVKALL